MGNGGVQCHLSCRSDYRTSRRRFVLCCRKYMAANLITIIILSLGIVGPLIAASNFADSLGMVGTVVNEIAALLDSPELVRPTQTVPLHSQEIQLNDVSFSYNDDGDKRD